MSYIECLDCAEVNRGNDGPGILCMRCEIAARPKPKKGKQKKGQPSPNEPYGSHGLARKDMIGQNGYVPESE